jgi:hypothetical protein
MQSVILTNKKGASTIVDSDIAEKIKKFGFHKTNEYIGITIAKNKKCLLHRYVLKAVKGQIIDHINGQTNDNRRCNLRICSISENICNSRKRRKGAKNRFVYVYCNISYNRKKPWFVRLCRNKKIVFYIYLRSEIVAALVADAFREKHYEYPGYLNFPVKVKRENLLDYLKRDKGKFFCVYFSRRSDGKLRKMICRTGIPGKQGGPGLPFDPKKKNLLSVYDIKKKKHRFIPLENVLCLSIKKQRVAVLN